ncbi:50S ribosomal protein L23, partial [Candidatus Peregrinibacteria bacterium]|nr:50S ribosomal protein L23 [Candidatus Peregrinibacteria bacterium]
MKDYTTIIQSVVTEKSSNNQAKGQYTFLVAKTATKIDVKHAVKALYGADVDTVRTLIGPSKTRYLKGKYEWVK